MDMKTKLLLLLLGLFSANCASSSTTTSTITTTTTSTTTTTTSTTTTVNPNRAPVSEDAPVADWVNGVNAAGWDFHLSLDGQAASSPLSIGLAFSLLRAGASGKTAETIDNIFGFPEQDTHKAANNVSLGLPDPQTGTLNIANRVFPDYRLNVAPEFLDTSEQFYGAEIEALDFGPPPGEAVKAMNAWVSDETQGLIPTIVEDADFPDLDSDVFHWALVNAIYFKYEWQSKFKLDKELAPFNLSNEETTDIQYMSQTKTFPFVRLENADAVGVPYKQSSTEENRLIMWLVVPHEIEGLADVERSINETSISGFRQSRGYELLDLSAPKWSQELPPTDMTIWLCEQGGLCPEAPLDNMGKDFFYRFAKHAVKVIVDEKGTEAAAATVVGGAAAVSLEPIPIPIRLIVDRPFLWAIVDDDTGAILFLGRVLNPSQTP